MRLRGFDKPPVKHFYRPLWLFLDGIMRKKPRCSANFYFEHIKQYYKTFKDYNKFSLWMFSYLVHDSSSLLFNLDDDMYNFLEYFHTTSEMDR